MRRETKHRTILAAIFALLLMGCVLLSAQSGESINWQRYLAGRFMAETVQYAVLPGATTTHAALAAIDANIRAIKYGSGISLSSLVAYLSTVNGTGFGTPTVVDLRPYVMTPGWKFSWVDSGNKTAVAYGKAAGTGETLGADVFSGWDFTSGWTPAAPPYDITISDADDLLITSNFQYMTSDANKYTLNALYKSVFAVTGVPLSLQEGGSGIVMAASGAGATYKTARQTNKALIQPSAAGTGASKVTTLQSRQVLTPTAKGLTLTSTPGGTTFNWASVESGFNPNSATFTLNITRE